MCPPNIRTVVIDDMKKLDRRDLLVVIIFFLVTFPIVLHLGAVSGGYSMFSKENILEVSLYYIIGIPVLYFIEYFLVKQKNNKW